MTNEITMCKWNQDYVDGTNSDNGWMPIDPQPCCENCDNATERNGVKVCFVVVDYIQTPIGEPLAYIIRYPKFYCNFWRPKQ